MTTTDESSGAQDLLPDPECWTRFGMELEGVLGSMAATGDRLTLDLPGVADASGAAPRARFAVQSTRGGPYLRAEIRGDAQLAPRFALGVAGERELYGNGWRAVRELDGRASLWTRRLGCGDEARALGPQLVSVLRDHSAVIRPEFLSMTVDGPAAASALGLSLVVGGAEVLHELPTAAGTPLLDASTPVSPENRGQMVALVREAVTGWLGEETKVDDDGDVLVMRDESWMWVHAMPEQPGVELSSCVVSGVADRRAAAVELALLNRNSRWLNWILRDDDIWQIAHIPGAPFVPSHLTKMMDVFMDALVAVTPDLTLRTQGPDQ